MTSAGIADVPNVSEVWPARRPGSVRRTSSLDMSWPEGLEGNLVMIGRCRDVVTHADGTAPVTIADIRSEVEVGEGRRIAKISSDPGCFDLRHLAGAQLGKDLRSRLTDIEFVDGSQWSAFRLLLDDLAGASVIAGFAWTRWDRAGLERYHARSARSRVDMTGVCAGYAPGSQAVELRKLGIHRQNTAPAPISLCPDDAAGCHDLPAQIGIATRRVRRIDVWPDDDGMHVDAAFQDSSTDPGGGRLVFHEYRLQATAESKSGALRSILAEPHVLPYDECPGAVANLDRLLGVPLPELRTVVFERLARDAGCTHLNDALRALADVPFLAASVAAASSRSGRSVGRNHFAV